MELRSLYSLRVELGRIVVSHLRLYIPKVVVPRCQQHLPSNNTFFIIVGPEFLHPLEEHQIHG
jgi:hypothetical protein